MNARGSDGRSDHGDSHEATEAIEEFDVLVIGAGISGIGMACHLSRELPEKRIAILERRERMGGTWDLFRYPGIRSDSDMFTFGFPFRPWTDPKVLAGGGDIRRYIEGTAKEYELQDKIRYGQVVQKASWSNEQQRWTVTALDGASGEKRVFRCQFLSVCTGYYNYDAGYTPEFAGRDDFEGRVIHPQHWPGDLDYSGKTIVVIGSGATAVTLVPALAEQAGHVVMLQRSPTYIMSLPAVDKLAQWMMRRLPKAWAFRFLRWRNVRLQRALYQASRFWPNFTRKIFLSAVSKQLDGVADMRHFSPAYQPWDQRLCAVPDGDFFTALKAGKASVLTDEVQRFTRRGLRLKSGEELPADIIVTATGLDLRLLGGMHIEVDGRQAKPEDLLTYKAVLIQDAPNLAVLFGYTNATWTLKADIAAKYLCRLIKHMDAKQYAVAVPRAPENMAVQGSVMDSLSAGYVMRAADRLPRQGKTPPWRVLNHYAKDREMLLQQPLEDGYLQFSPPLAQH